MHLKHASTTVSASFDDPNLVSSAGLVPIMKLAARAGLQTLADQWLTVPTDKSANAGLKVASLGSEEWSPARTRSTYADIEIMSMKVALASEIAVLGASGTVALAACRHNYRASRKASSLSVGR